MICNPCKDKAHLDCVGGTWCDCQHRAGKTTEESMEDIIQEFIDGAEANAA